MFQMCGVFAEFERAMIVERVNSGLARAKAKGVRKREDARQLPSLTRCGAPISFVDGFAVGMRMD
jgi:DNA invertase Pin-like site-specific DNA recombinase